MKKRSQKPTLISVVCTYTNQFARAVYVAGSFNEWSPDVSALTHIALGGWQIELLLPPGRYEYLFVVDGAWVVDPRAREFCPNPHGGVNGVFRV